MPGAETGCSRMMGEIIELEASNGPRRLDLGLDEGQARSCVRETLPLVILLL